MEHKRLIHSTLEPAINYWFRAQSADIYGKFYLYVRKAHAGEKIAIPVIAKEPPNSDYFRAMGEPLCIGWTVEQARFHCYEALQTAPILGCPVND